MSKIVSANPKWQAVLLKKRTAFGSRVGNDHRMSQPNKTPPPEQQHGPPRPNAGERR